MNSSACMTGKKEKKRKHSRGRKRWLGSTELRAAVCVVNGEYRVDRNYYVVTVFKLCCC